MMKKRNNYAKIFVGLAIISSIFASCSKDFLQNAPSSQIVVSTYFQLDQEAISVTNSAYAQLHAYRLYWMDLGMLDILADKVVINNSGYSDGLSYYQLKEGTAGPANITVQAVWTESYKGISYCNEVIEYVGGSTSTKLDNTLKEQCVGQALFLRALYYFNLVRLYGDVPLVLSPISSPDEAYPARTPLKDVYTQIIADLKAAADKLPESWADASKLPLSWRGHDQIGRATSGAANGLLAKVYITLATRNYGDKYTKDGQEYTNAATFAKKVIDKVPTVYDLMPNYVDFFNPDASGNNCKESLFEVQFNTGPLYGMGGEQACYYGLPYWILNWGGWGWCEPTRAFVSSYEAGDKRLGYSIFSQGDVWVDPSVVYDTIAYPTRTGHNTRKYDATWATDRSRDGGQNSMIDMNILRLAEVYLIYAEAELGLGVHGVADEYVNKVRARAFKDDTHGLTNVTVQQIWDERSKELFVENDRYFDLLRTNQFLTEMNKQVKGDFTSKIQLTEKNLYWPIPQDQLNVDPNLTPNDWQ